MNPKVSPPDELIIAAYYRSESIFPDEKKDPHTHRVLRQARMPKDVVACIRKLRPLMRGTPSVYWLRTQNGELDAMAIGESLDGTRFIIARWSTVGLKLPSLNGMQAIVEARWKHRDKKRWAVAGGIAALCIDAAYLYVSIRSGMTHPGWPFILAGALLAGPSVGFCFAQWSNRKSEAAYLKGGHNRHYYSWALTAR